MLARLTPVALALCLLATAAIAQTPSTRIRGSIVTIDGQAMTVATREGPTVDVTLGDPLTVATVKRVALGDIAPNTYVGAATRTGADGKPVAIEVLVFPETMRGAGEGHYPWDLEPGSMMTNATVSGTAAAASGRELTLTYKGGSQTIMVPPDAAVVTFSPAERSDLKPGEKVFFSATKGADGKFTTSRITVSKDGVAPPM
jgi:hypothetical protein